MLAVLLALAPCFQVAKDTPPTNSSSPSATVEREAEFVQELASLEKLRRTRRWKDLRDGVLRLLAAHAGADYARARRARIEDEVRQASFWIAHPAPDPRQLVGGRIEVLDRSADRIRLRYERGVSSATKTTKVRTTRPAVGGGDSSTARSAPFPDFDAEGPFNVHPLQFSGPYGIEIAGQLTRLGTELPSLLLLLDPETALCISIGADVRVQRLVDRRLGEDVVSPAASGLEPGRNFALAIQVSRTTIQVRVNERLVLTAPKPDGLYGWFAYRDGTGIQTIALGGATEGQWIDSLVDAAVEEARKAFDAQWNPASVLPAWLLEPMKAGDDSAERAAEALVTFDAASSFGVVWNKHWEAGELDRCLGLLDGESARGATEALRLKLRAECLATLGRLPEALEAARALRTAAPRLFEARILCAVLLSRTAGRAAALEEARTAVTDFPREARAYELLGNLLIAESKLEDARSMLERAALSGADPAGLAAITASVLRAIQGPEWRAPKRYESKHYVVASDMDRKACVEMANVLEDTYAWLQRNVAPVELPAGTRLRAFVFSGREGYSTYCGDLLGDEQRWTAGLFSPPLQQLLLWNHPDRAEMLRTVRHEGFHQWLDRLVPEVPVWLNEGLAQRFETLHEENGALVLGGLSKSARERLAQGRWPSLGHLLAMSHAEFVADASLHYALSWALLEHLATGDEAGRAVYARLMRGLASERDGAAAVRAAFAGIDLHALKRRLADWVGK